MQVTWRTIKTLNLMLTQLNTIRTRVSQVNDTATARTMNRSLLKVGLVVKRLEITINTQRTLTPTSQLLRGSH